MTRTRAAAIPVAHSGAPCTTPLISGQGALTELGACSIRRLLTHVPLIGSAGCEAYQPTACTRSALCVRMFQSALVLRVVLADTRTPSPDGFGSTKFRMPCLSAVLPVAMVDHSSGESLGSMVRRFARVPAAISAARLGICPRASSGSMICQSAASQPRIKRRWTGRVCMRCRIVRSKRGAAVGPPLVGYQCVGFARTANRAGNRLSGDVANDQIQPVQGVPTRPVLERLALLRLESCPTQ